jgi:hypothetical protein
LGYHISSCGVVISKTSFARMTVNVFQLYERHASQERMEEYLKNWIRWAKAKVGLLYSPIIFRSFSYLYERCNFNVKTIKHKRLIPNCKSNLTISNGRLIFG